MFKVPEIYRIRKGTLASGEKEGNNGAFVLPLEGTPLFLFCLASDGQGWEHVSVSVRIRKGGMLKSVPRCPTWDEMCVVKRLFWGAEDTVIQFHPQDSAYVNCHPFVLHLWRETGEATIRLPNTELIGPK